MSWRRSGVGSSSPSRRDCFRSCSYSSSQRCRTRGRASSRTATWQRFSWSCLRTRGAMVEFLSRTGWRRKEGLLLQWSSVDRDGEIIRLERARSKSGKPRTFPYGRFPALRALIEKRWAGRSGLYVFQIDGQPIGLGALRCAWRRATRRAGLAGRLSHDLRRTAARNIARAGLSEGGIMALCGWGTPSTVRPYGLIGEADSAPAAGEFAPL